MYVNNKHDLNVCKREIQIAVSYNFLSRKVQYLVAVVFIMFLCLYLYFQSNLNGHKNIIGYVDSNVTHLGGGVHELLLLMPYCKSQVLQMMNNRFIYNICSLKLSRNIDKNDP